MTFTLRAHAPLVSQTNSRQRERKWSVVCSWLRLYGKEVSMKVSAPTLCNVQSTAIEPLTIEDEQNPRVRIWNHGGECLSNAELLSLVIGKGVGNLTSIDIARSVMDECGNRWSELARMQPYDLYRHIGVGYSKAAKILAAIEVAKRLQSEKAEMY